ncbi:transposase [uncultured Fusobacterium sp.]|uniref:transposase n=1 Tax=uncultured Fusobacterium sp. TaxID=159267 RepID=UPI0034596DF8
MNIPTTKVKILSNRSSSYLKEYFFSFFLKVKYIVIDIYQSYPQLIRTLFPNIKISLDRFHLVQLINRNSNKIRIRIIN